MYPNFLLSKESARSYTIFYDYLELCTTFSREVVHFDELKNFKQDHRNQFKPVSVQSDQRKKLLRCINVCTFKILNVNFTCYVSLGCNKKMKTKKNI